MRLTGVWMVSVDQDRTLPHQYLLKFGNRLGYLTVVSKVPCARIVCYVARNEGEIAS